LKEPRPAHLKKNIQSALKDENLREAVARATATALAKRARIVDQTPHWESLRAEAARIKRDVVDHLDEHLEAFEAACARGGIQVHWARDAAEACARVLEILQDQGVTEVVKSKSMVTEEIGLNAYLEAHGIASLETDLGEYIVQLAGEMPSHLTAPALHMSRRDIGRLFAENLGTTYTEDPESLTAVARERLRDRFLSAGAGISGVNFGLAREGGFVVVENECNATLTMHLPPIHVAVMGLERLIPSLEDLPVLLKLLPASATGQAMTSYVHSIQGPRGSRAVHVILVDNGRTRILADPDLRELLHCIRCGACLNGCPVYQRVGGHAYGWVYPGPIGAALIPLFLGLDAARDLPFASSLCGACFDMCPVRIDLPRHLLRLRSDVTAAGPIPVAERLALRAWSFAATRPRIYRVLAAAQRIWSRLGIRMPVREWTRTRDFPPAAPRPFSTLWNKEEENA